MLIGTIDSTTPPPSQPNDMTLFKHELHASNPIPQFLKWFNTSKDASPTSEPDVCTLSTAELPSGKVSSRIVQLKALSNDGNFIFFTNLDTSRKARDLTTNSHVALVFHWGHCGRQVRVEGVVKECTDEDRRKYFSLTTRRSRIASWTSSQSEGLQPAESTSGDGDDGRFQLERRAAEMEKRFAGIDDVPMPDNWGVLQIVPARVEFWQSRKSRLHDRFVYEWEGSEENENGKWIIARLSP